MIPSLVPALHKITVNTRTQTKQRERHSTPSTTQLQSNFVFLFSIIYTRNSLVHTPLVISLILQALLCINAFARVVLLEDLTYPLKKILPVKIFYEPKSSANNIFMKTSQNLFLLSIEIYIYTHIFAISDFQNISLQQVLAYF